MHQVSERQWALYKSEHLDVKSSKGCQEIMLLSFSEEDCLKKTATRRFCNLIYNTTGESVISINGMWGIAWYKPKSIVNIVDGEGWRSSHVQEDLAYSKCISNCNRCYTGFRIFYAWEPLSTRVYWLHFSEQPCLHGTDYIMWHRDPRTSFFRILCNGFYLLKERLW